MSEEKKLKDSAVEDVSGGKVHIHVVGNNKPPSILGEKKTAGVWTACRNRLHAMGISIFFSKDK